MTIQLKGGPELLRLLDELPKNLERNVIRGGLRAGAKVIQQQAKANVPVKTGQLKRTIGIGTRTEAPSSRPMSNCGAKAPILACSLNMGSHPT